jgi:hypothetical protein
MKLQYVFLAIVATATAQTPASGKSNSKASSEFGNIIGSLMAMFSSLNSTLTDAGNQIRNGTPPSVVFDQTLPKVLPEARLLRRIELPSDNAIRPMAKRARASFGPYVLVGKNVSLPPYTFIASTVIIEYYLTGQPSTERVVVIGPQGTRQDFISSQREFLPKQRLHYLDR